LGTSVFVPLEWGGGRLRRYWWVWSPIGACLAGEQEKKRKEKNAPRAVTLVAPSWVGVSDPIGARVTVAFYSNASKERKREKEKKRKKNAPRAATGWRGSSRIASCSLASARGLLVV
jgi:hypothetical protein